MPKPPVYRASGFEEIFAFYPPHYLAWLPNEETFFAHGHSYDDVNVVDISWFYDKTIGSSIADVKTGESYPAEETPNYQDYLEPSGPPPTKEVTRTCPSCGATVGITKYTEGPQPARQYCPACGAYVEYGVSIRLIEGPPPPPVYTCPYCGATFATQAELDAHIASEHPTEPPPPPPSEYSWIRGLLTLKPKPSKEKAFDLGFNLINPYAGLPSGWIAAGGKVIYTTKTVRADETGIIAYSTCDEPDCHKHNPYSELELVRKMQTQTSLPVGTTVVGDIGCGIKGTAPSKEEYQRQWIEVINQMDLVLIDVYPYKKPEYIGGRTPLEEMEYRHQFFSQNITVPIIIIIQAHQSRAVHTKPNPMEQVKFWVDRGYGYIVYPWDDTGSPIGGVIDMQTEWGEANAYAGAPIPPPPPPPTYTCPYCGATFSSQAELDAHIASVHPPPVYTCPYCGATFGSQAELDTHIADVHTFVCPHCGAVFHTQAELDSHIASMHPPLPPVYTCPHCGATFSSQAELNDHIASEHPTEPTYTCPHCGATFATQEDLDAHIASVHPIAVEVSWYKRYAPLLVTGTGALGALTLFLLWPRRRKA